MALKEIISQPVALRLLKESLRQGIDTNSFLFFGPRGVGKSYAARNFIKAINCTGSNPTRIDHPKPLKDGSNPERIGHPDTFKDRPNEDSCDRCISCTRLDSNLSPDLLWLKPQADEGSISIDSVRHIRYLMALKPYEAKKRVFVLEDAHSLTGEAQDALLKVLEEPQDNSIFILITSKPHLLRQTVISRCHRIRFNAIPDAIIEKILSDEFTLKRDNLTFVNNLSSGSLADAKRLAGMDIFSSKNRILDNFIISPLGKIPATGTLELADELKNFRKKEGIKASAGECLLEFKDVIRIFLSFFRDIIMFKIGITESLVNFDRVLEIERFSREYELDELYVKLNSIMELESLLLQNVNEELAFIGMFEEILN